MMFPRYEIGDIVKASSKKGDSQEYYLVLDKKWPATQPNMADLYLILCLGTGSIYDTNLQETIYTKVEKVA